MRLISVLSAWIIALSGSGCTRVNAINRVVRPEPSAVAITATSDSFVEKSTSTSNSVSSTPNILFVVADDFGLDASPCYSIGAEKPNMPNLASLCAQGLVFDNVWAYPTCTPTRASILTGQYGIHTNIMQVDEVLAPTTPTILQAVSKAPTNYATAVIGKWHVSGRNADPNIPAQFGAQYYAGFLTGALTDYYAWDVIINGTQHPETRYSTTALTDYAIDWVGTQKQPWFLWLAYNAPHTPFHVPPAGLYTQSGLNQGDLVTAQNVLKMYFAAAEALDHELGRLLVSLPDDVRSNTTVFFIGDNGTPQCVIQAPFSATHAKDSIYEGGIHIPMIVAGAGVTRIGQREAALINSTDLFATFADIAQVKQSLPADSISFASALTSTAFKGRTHAYMDFRSDGKVITAIRDARYKLIEFDESQRQLFDLQADPYETNDLLATTTTITTNAIVDALIAKREALQVVKASTVYLPLTQHGVAEVIAGALKEAINLKRTQKGEGYEKKR
jgi:arylsulfatase B